MKLPYLLIAGLALVSSVNAANVIVNGGFETGNFNGWTVTGSAYTIQSTTPLDGSHSARQVRTGASSISQTFTPFTDTATVGFLFSADYPTTPSGDRVLHLFLEGTTGRLNLRVNNSGALQTLNRVNNVVIGWEDTGISGLALDGTPYAVTISLNSFGAGASYDIAVGAATATGLTIFDNAVLSDLSTLRFEANSNSTGGFTLLDNVSVIPEPTTALLGGLGLLALLRRRR